MGRKRDLRRREQARKLRDRGLTLQQIADRLGITRQGAAYLLRTQSRRRPQARCRACEAMLDPTAPPRYDRQVYCPACLARHPEASLAERLRALRVAAGLSGSELARRVGVSPAALSSWERGRVQPSRGVRGRLLAALGTEYYPPADPALVPKPAKPRGSRGRPKKEK